MLCIGSGGELHLVAIHLKEVMDSRLRLNVVDEVLRCRPCSAKKEPYPQQSFARAFLL